MGEDTGVDILEKDTGVAPFDAATSDGDGRRWSEKVRKEVKGVGGEMGEVEDEEEEAEGVREEGREGSGG